MPTWEWREKAFLLSRAHWQEVIKEFNIKITKGNIKSISEGKLNEIERPVHFEVFL